MINFFIEYEGAANELKEWGIPVIKVDGTREKELADQYGVQGWPSMRLFRKGRVYMYDGPKEKADIVAYVKEQVPILFFYAKNLH